MQNVRWIVLGALLAAVGCGDDGEGSSKPVNMLSQSELDALCMDVNAEIGTLYEDAEGICTLAGAGAGDTQACETAKQGCLAVFQSDAGFDPSTVTGECPTVDDARVTSCQVTVAQATACMEARVAQLQSVLSSASCDMPGSLSLDSLETPSECLPLEENCSDLLQNPTDVAP